MGWGEAQGPDGDAVVPPTPPNGEAGDIVAQPHQVFLATSWDGSAPQVGAFMVTGDVYRVVQVTRGPGVAQYTLEAVAVDPGTALEQGVQVLRWLG